VFWLDGLAFYMYVNKILWTMIDSHDKVADIQWPPCWIGKLFHWVSQKQNSKQIPVESAKVWKTWASHDCFWFHLWLDEKVARDYLSQSHRVVLATQSKREPLWMGTQILQPICSAKQMKRFREGDFNGPPYQCHAITIIKFSNYTLFHKNQL